MEFLSNEGVNALGDKLRSALSEGDRLSIISSYFTVFAFGELKDELSRIEELRFLFDEPTFVQQMPDLKDPREFVISQRSRERGVGGTGLELTLRNNLNQRTLAQECAEWVRSKATFNHVWNKLYDFQRDAVVGTIRKLERYKGCIIVDSVGFGKTFEALAVIKYYQERNDRVLALCPKRLRENWTLYTGNDERNPLVDDRLNYDVLNHTDLSRYMGFSGDINLETVRWGNYDLIASLSFAQYQLLAYVMPGRQKKYADRYADTAQLMALLSRLRDAQSQINVLRSQYRNKEATLAESSRLRIELKKAERVRDGVADEIKELCHGRVHSQNADRDGAVDW